MSALPPAKVTPKEAPPTLPPVYPIPLIEVACRALETTSMVRNIPIEMEPTLVALKWSAINIIRDGLASHERAAQEGRSRG